MITHSDTDKSTAYMDTKELSLLRGGDCDVAIFSDLVDDENFLVGSPRPGRLQWLTSSGHRFLQRQKQIQFRELAGRLGLVHEL